METHGGKGAVFKSCYRGIESGIIFDKDAERAKILGLQRPTWRVYQIDCVAAVESDVGGDLAVNLLDVDPYGNPWPVLKAFFDSQRKRGSPLCVAVNDGMRLKIKMGHSWEVGCLQDVVSKYGNDLYPIYLEVCQEMLKEKASQAGYRLARFAGYYCGYSKQMTHYLGVLEKN